MPLHWAALLGQCSVAELLLKMSATVDAKDREGRGLGNKSHGFIVSKCFMIIIFPHFSTFFIHFSTFFLCLVLSFENTGRTALHCAAHNGKTAVAQLLLANGAKVDETDGEGLLSRSQKMVFMGRSMHRQNQTQMGEERTRCLISSFHQWFAMV